MQSVCRLPEGLRRRSLRRARPGPKAAPQLDQCSLQSPSRRTVTVAVPPAQAPVRRPLPWCQPENRRRGPGPKAIAVVPAAKPTPWCWSMSRLHGPDPKVESVVPVREPTPWFRPEGRPLGASPEDRPPGSGPKAIAWVPAPRPTPWSWPESHRLGASPDTDPFVPARRPPRGRRSEDQRRERCRSPLRPEGRSDSAAARPVTGPRAEAGCALVRLCLPRGASIGVRCIRCESGTRPVPQSNR